MMWLLKLVVGLLLCLSLAAEALADSGITWNAGPALTSQNATYAGVLISDTQLLLLSKQAADGTGKTIEVRISPDFGNTWTLAVTSPNTGLASAIPGLYSAIQIPAAGVLLAAGAGGTPATSFLRGAAFSWAFPAVTIAPGGLVNTTAHSLTMQAGTILGLLQTSAGGYVCRSTDNALTFTCTQPGGFGAVAAPTAVAGLGTLQGLASPRKQIWLALDNSNTVWRSSDDGQTFASVTTLSANASTNALICVTSTTCLALVSSAAATQLQVFRSTDAGATWAQTLNLPRADRVTTLLSMGQGIVVALGDPTVTNVPFGYRSTDFGASWSIIPPASIANPLAGSSFISHISVFPNSTGAAATVANFCTGGGTCNTQTVLDPLIATPTTMVLSVNQGAPAAMTNAWPTYLTRSGVAVGTLTNPLTVLQHQATVVAAFPDVTVGGAATGIGGGPNPNRVSLICTNNDATTSIRVGDAGVTATTGVRLRPGASITVTGTYAVLAISEGPAVTVSCTLESF